MWGIWYFLPLYACTVAEKKHGPATANTWSINYLWNRVRNALIFLFYPIRLPKHNNAPPAHMSNAPPLSTPPHFFSFFLLFVLMGGKRERVCVSRGFWGTTEKKKSGCVKCKWTSFPPLVRFYKEAVWRFNMKNCPVFPEQWVGVGVKVGEKCINMY